MNRNSDDRSLSLRLEQQELSPLDVLVKQVQERLQDAIRLLHRNGAEDHDSFIRISLAQIALSMDKPAIIELWANGTLDDFESALTSIGHGDITFCEVCRTEAHDADCPLKVLKTMATRQFDPDVRALRAARDTVGVR